VARYAAVDIGSNTLLLLVVERGEGGELVARRDLCRFGRLGQGLDRSGQLAEEAIERSLAIAREYRTVLDAEAPLGGLVALGTQAVREAGNADAFLAPAEEILGVPIQVVSGEREAELVFRSVVEAFPALAGGEVVVVDVGGASTEIIAGRGGVVSSLVSVPIGAVRLSERHLKSDPPSADEGRALIADIDGELAKLSLPRGAALIGTAGTATTLASVAQNLRVYQADKVQGYRIGRAEVERQLARYLELTVAEKRHLPGLEPQRADVIAGGAAIYARVASYLDAPEIITSDRGIRWGAVHELAAAAAG
jgi:exopolyphosphatase / guanosine-5'-triphosphate,3'-diphosphate pyrophosphatase